MTMYKWSQTANTNASADSTCTWAEGMAPSQVNDSARGNMAAIAKYRDDIAGAIATGGSSTAYTVTSYQVFDTLPHLGGQMVAFTPHTTNTGAACTLNVDGLGAKPLRSTTNVELPAGTLIQGTPYIALYNNSDAAFYLHGFFGNPYNIPIGSTLDYWLSTAPNSSFVFPYGQAISRTTYATLFASMSTTYGVGDGSTTFNLPDLRGRVTGSPDNMGGSDIGRLTGSNISSVRTTLGGAGGEGTHILVTSEIPSHSHTATDSGHTHVQHVNTVYNAAGAVVSGGAGSPLNTVAGTVTGTGTANITVGNTGGGTAHNVVQPMILCNRIMRVI